MKKEIEELRIICQKPVIHSEGESWYGIYFSRYISIYITYFLVKYTKATANFVTFLFILLGAIGDILIFTGKPVLAFIGVVLLHLWLILDAVDGEVARYRKKSSILGIYLDSLGHYIVNPGILMALGIYSFVSYNNTILLYISFFSFLVMMFLRLFDDLYYLTVSKTQNSNNKRYEVDENLEKSIEVSSAKKTSMIKNIINVLADDTVLVILITVIFLINIFYSLNIVILICFAFYLVLYTLLALYMLYKSVKKMN
ncbi:MAG: CDP-alcohol phosphatidyltransferase family protein [Bacillota bacterium]|nr:CDP-alcohol phosphatidyltransferase family protein [Bacillota bacterium]